MFRIHHISNNTLSIKNLILLFLTIVMGFASVITLAQITIPSSIDNAQQTIGRVTITSDGTASGTEFRDINYDGFGGTRISGLDGETGFSGKVLGIDDAGNLVYIFSENLVISGAGAGGGSEYWTGNGADIYNSNTGNVGIGTASMSGKLHIKSAGNTDVYIEETNPGSAANLNLKNTIRTWAIGGDSSPDLFYVGIASGSRYLTITPTGKIGIGTDAPKAQLQVSGNFIAGNTNNGYYGVYVTDNNYIPYITGIITPYSSIAGGSGNSIIIDQNSEYIFIGGGEGNSVQGLGEDAAGHSSIVGGKNNIIQGQGGFIGGGNGNINLGGQAEGSSSREDGFRVFNYNSIVGGKNNKLRGEYSFIGGGNTNTISGLVNYSFIGGGGSNTIHLSNFSFIGGGQFNTINRTSTHSVIPGGQNNTISGSSHSFAAGFKAKIINYPNTFVRNSDIYNDFYAGRKGSFLINVPFSDDGDIPYGGVGINTNNPKTPLDVNGLIRTRQVTTPLTDCPGTTYNIEGSIAYDGTDFRGCTNKGRKQLNNQYD